MKQELIDLYDNAPEEEQKFIEYMLHGNPFMGAVSKQPQVKSENDLVYAIHGQISEINLLRACLISADVGLCNEDSFWSSVFVYTLIFLGRGYTGDVIKNQLVKIIDGTVATFGSTDELLH